MVQLDTLSDKYRMYQEDGILEVGTPTYIKKNLADWIDLRYYQEEAVSYFNYHLNHLDEEDKPVHLLYHMATGSGKTIVMAANILQLYKRGYNNFIFFVDSSTVLQKTKENFLNQASSKYLFDEDISFNERDVRTRDVDNFSTVSSDEINIHFTTIQGLHMALRDPKENSITYEEFKDQELVLLSDESHHLDQATKGKDGDSWENTVMNILNMDDENILLEYTATPGLENESIAEKYEDKIIYQYPLEQYRKDGFSKEVNVHQADLEPLDRAFRAIIMSQYRKKVAERNDVWIKPVVLMKASHVNPPKNRSEEKVVSSEFRRNFHEKLKDLRAEDLRDIKSSAEGPVKEAFEFFEREDISLSNLASELRDDFREEKSLVVDSKQEKEDYQVEANSLEDRDNPYRVIFAVDALNEGWDVLNLYDIVRLYNKVSSTSGPSKTTIREAQLIGRGARYYPFKVEEDQEKFKRKYDEDLENDCRILEELHYHSADNPDYIRKLKTALEDEGVIPEEEKKEVQLKIKDSFKETDTWKNGRIYLNKKKVKKQKDMDNLSSIASNKTYSHELRTKLSSSIAIFEEENPEDTGEKKTSLFQLSEFGDNVLRSGIQKKDFYSFENLKFYFKDLESASEFVESEDYLSKIEVEVKGRQDQLQDLSQEEKMDIVLEVLEELEKDIRKKAPTEKGTKEFYAEQISEKFRDKKIKRSKDEDNKSTFYPLSNPHSSNRDLRMDLSDKDWYAYEENFGTTQEKYFLSFLDNAIENIREDYEEVYLLRNEKFFKIYRFSDGRAFEPDFVMFLKEKGVKEPSIYQIFIEPKGEGYIDKDKWKEEFLQKIEDEYTLHSLYENTKYRLIGLQFYNEEKRKREFKEEMEKKLDISRLY